MAAIVLSPTIEIRTAPASMLVDDPVYGTRPRLRGRFHQLAAIASVPMGLELVAGQASAATRLGALAYALTAFTMFVTSACYHRLADSVMARFWMRRLDHSMIFIHIAGATTPIAIHAVGGRAGLALLALSWGGALTGVGLKLTQLTIERDPCPWLFPLLGWLPMVALPAVAASTGAAGAALLICSGVVYGMGVVCFSRKHPNPVPAVFGYHEIFHICTLVAGCCQYVLTIRLVAG